MYDKAEAAPHRNRTESDTQVSHENEDKRELVAPSRGHFSGIEALIRTRVI